MTYTAPTTHVAGETLPAADYNVIVNDVIDHETRILALPRGYKGSATLSSFTTTSTSYVDVTGLSVTFTAETSRRYCVTLFCGMANNSANISIAVINDGTSDIAEQYTQAVANTVYTGTAFAFTTPSAGSVTYTVKMKVVGGTGEMYGTTTRQSLAAKLMVEDIGAA